MKLSNIWNGKFVGVIGLISNLVSIFFSKVIDTWTTFCFIYNIAACGHNVFVMRGLTYRHPSSIYLKNNIVIGRSVSITSEQVCKGELHIDDGVSIGDNCNIDFTGNLYIKEGTHFAHHITIITHDHGYDYRNKPIGKPLIIENNVFLGSNTLILTNCNNIGKNSIIGAGSVVTCDVPENAIIAGNPAKIIKYKITD